MFNRINGDFTLTIEPKSGDEQDHIAPRLTVASIASNVSIQFGM